MADFSEEIARKIAAKKASLYWPEGEPGDKRRGKRGAGGEKPPRDPKAKRKEKTEEETGTFEPISEFVKKERTRRLERALKAMETRRQIPKEVPFKKWLSEPGNLDRALKRGMVKMIASQANPKSKDTEDVATVGGRRYAKTDLYQAPIRERVKEATTRTKYETALWWDSNKRVVVVAAVSLVAGWMIYSVWKNAQLEKDLARQRARRHAAHKTGWFVDPHFDERSRLLAGGREPHAWEFEEFAARPSGYSWW
jgi:hypothetical protein